MNKIFLSLLVAMPLFGATVFEECRWATGTGTTNTGATGEGVWSDHEHSSQGYITKNTSSQGWYSHTQSLQINGSPQLTEDVVVSFSPYRDTLGVRLSFKVISEDFGNSTESNFLILHGSDGNNGASAFLYQDGSGVLRIRIKGVDGAAAEQVIGQTDAITTGVTYQLELLKRRNRTGGTSAKLYDSAGTIIGSEIINTGVTSEDDRCDLVRLGSNDDWKGSRNMIFDIVQMDDAGYVGAKSGGSPPEDSSTISVTESPAAAFEYSLHPSKQETGLPDSLIFSVNSGYVCDGITGDTTVSTVATGTDTIIWPAISGNKSVTINGHAWPEPTMTYNANSGTGTMTDTLSPYDSGATVTVLSNTFTRSGYVFTKWNTAANGSGTDRSPAATFTIVANTTLYAQWEAEPDSVTDAVIHRPDTALIDTILLIDAVSGTKFGGTSITGKSIILITFDTTNFDTGSIDTSKLTRISADSTWRLNVSPNNVIKMKHGNFTILITGDEIDPFQISGTITGNTLVYDTVAAGASDTIHWSQCAADSVIISRQTGSIEGSWTSVDTVYAHNVSETEGYYVWTNPFAEVTHDVFIRVLDYDVNLVGYKNYEITEGAEPDTFTVTISITGNHLTEPDIDTTPFVADGRYETGTEITITATQAALHKLVQTATFPASPLVFTITRDTTIIIQSDTFPKFTRDTIIPGGHATVAVVPATLTPVDSATACTTSVTAVDEGWRVDSIVHYSGGVRTSAVTYPATQITYLIVANTIDSIFTSEIPAAQYTLTMATIGTGTVTPSAGDTTVDSGAGIPITATPGIGYTFTGWTTVSGTILFNADSSRCSLSTAATLRANFTIKTYTITGTDVGNGSHGFLPANDSVIDSNSTGRIYAVYGDSVVFNGFSDDTAGGVRAGDTLTVTMHADRAITLTFTDIPDSSDIAFTQPDNGTITIDPAALRRAAGDTTEIVFTADDHYHFGGWTGGLADSTNDTVNYVFPAAGTMTFSATPYIDTHTVTPINGDNMVLIPMMPLQVEYGSPCSLVVGCDPGYLWRVNAGPWNNTQLDTFVITVISDTVLTGESYLIPTDARSVVISPASLTIDTGLTRQFTATYYDTIGRVADPQPVTTWASTIGSVGPTGLFSSGTEIGTGIVRGYNGSIADTSNVTVRYSSGGAMVNRWNSFNGTFRMAWRRFR